MKGTDLTDTDRLDQPSVILEPRSRTGVGPVHGGIPAEAIFAVMTRNSVRITDVPKSGREVAI